MKDSRRSETDSADPRLLIPDSAPDFPVHRSFILDPGMNSNGSRTDDDGSTLDIAGSGKNLPRSRKSLPGSRMNIIDSSLEIDGSPLEIPCSPQEIPVSRQDFLATLSLRFDSPTNI